MSNDHKIKLGSDRICRISFRGWPSTSLLY